MELFQNKPPKVITVNVWKMLADHNMPKLLKSSVFKDLCNGDNKFDLIFTELFFGQEPLVVLGHIFNAPVVTYASYGYETEPLSVAPAP